MDKKYLYEGVKKKETWIELLRVLCMLWIIAFHFADHGTIDMEQCELSFNWSLLALARVGGVSVIVFLF